MHWRHHASQTHANLLVNDWQNLKVRLAWADLSIWKSCSILSPTSRQVLSNGSIFSPLVGQILSNLNSYWLKLMRNMVSCHDSLLEFHRIFTTNQLGQSHIQLTISQRVHWKTFRAIVLYVDFILSKKNRSRYVEWL